MQKRHLISWTIISGITVLHAGLNYSQDYPNKPIRIITSKVGTGSDAVARLIAQGVSGPFGQVIADNRANSIEFVTKAPPDGYNLLLDGGSLWTEPLLRKTQYSMDELSPITMVLSQTNVLVVTASLPVKSTKELIALAKTKPGELNYAGSAGSIAHLAAESFKALAGVDIVRINYSSGNVALTDLIGGRVQMQFGNPSSLMENVKSGKLRALGVTSSQPSALMPGVPTVAETVPGFEAVGLQGIFAPAKTPDAIIRRLNQEIVRYLNTPEARERTLAAGIESMTSSPEQLGAKIKSETAKWSKVIKDANIQAE